MMKSILAAALVHMVLSFGADPLVSRDTMAEGMMAFLREMPPGDLSRPPFRTWSFPTASMQPTLSIGDIALAADMSRLGRPLATGDIVAFLTEENGETYIKRIIGLPGDQVQMVEGRLAINGQVVALRERGRAIDTDSIGKTVHVSQYQETLPNGLSYTVNNVADGMVGDNTASVLVPEGHYYVLGDNRDRSRDSRFQGVGLVPADKIKGIVVARWSGAEFAAVQGLMGRFLIKLLF